MPQREKTNIQGKAFLSVLVSLALLLCSTDYLFAHGIHDIKQQSHITVELSGIPEEYGTAFKLIIREALHEYENSFGLHMPDTIYMYAQLDPNGNTRMFTDGEDSFFLTVNSLSKLAPFPSSGVRHIYGICHELGHIAMYRLMRNMLGISVELGEGWASYAGCVVVDSIVDRLGVNIWPETYVSIFAEGTELLDNRVADRSLNELSGEELGAEVFWQLHQQYGQATVGAAMAQALSQNPNGVELMPLFIEKLRRITVDSLAGDWIPRELMEHQFEWEIQPRYPDEDFFSDQKVVFSDTTAVLLYDNNSGESRQSISGTGETVLFATPEGQWVLNSLSLYGERYGTTEPPAEYAWIYICDEEFEIVAERFVPYSVFEKNEAWYQLYFEPVPVPQRFYVCVYFNATGSRGFYVYKDHEVHHSHSFLALPFSGIRNVSENFDWMIRASLNRASSSEI